MTPERPEIKDNSEYSIMQACKLLGIHRNTLRLKNIPFKIKKESSRKVYTGKALLKFWENN